MIHTRKYGEIADIDFRLFMPDGIDLTNGATLTAGDTVISKDGAAFVNTTNTAISNTLSNVIQLTAVEMSAKRIVIVFRDLTATKEWLDTSIEIETYGNVNALHQFDLDNPNVILAPQIHTGATVPTVSQLTGHTPQTGDGFPVLGTPAGASISADNAEIKAETALIKSDSGNTLTQTTDILADTADMQPKLGLPAGTDMSADIASIKNDTQPLAIDWADGGRLDLLLDRLITQIDTPISEPGQTALPVSAKLGLKIDYLYKMMRNKTISSSTTIQVFSDDGATVDHVRSHTDDGTSYTRGEVGSGP